MITIRTTYHGATDTKSSRITATTYANGKREFRSYSGPERHFDGSVDDHRPAAQALCERLGFTLTGQFGEEPSSSPRGYIFMATRNS